MLPPKKRQHASPGENHAEGGREGRHTTGRALSLTDLFGGFNFIQWVYGEKTAKQPDFFDSR
jgi:hypothetical protein